MNFLHRIRLGFRVALATVKLRLAEHEEREILCEARELGLSFDAARIVYPELVERWSHVVGRLILANGAYYTALREARS